MHKLNTDFPIEIILVWVVCIAVFVFMIVKWWIMAYKNDEYIKDSDDRLLSDLHMLGVNDE